MSNVDGIQKMSLDELKKKREIVLGMLGEDINVPKSSNKKVDGILYEKKISQDLISREVVAEAEKKHAEEYKKEWQQEFRNNSLVGKNVLEDLIVGKKNTKPVESNFAEKTPDKRVIEKLSVEKKVTRAKQRAGKSKNIKNKIVKIKRQIFSRIKHGKAIFSFTTARLKITLEKFSFISLMSILVLSIIYLSLFFLIVSYKIDNSFFRFLNAGLPVPAIIVDNRLVDFYDYVDMKNKLNGDSEGAKRELIKKVITKNFLQGYGSSDVVANKTVNSAALNRIKKIKILIDKDGDFDQIAGKYGDRRELINLENNDFAKYEYGDKLKTLNVNEVSDVVIASDGYYIFKCFKKDNNYTSIGYIFVQAKNFDQYVEETAKNIYFVSFVD